MAVEEYVICDTVATAHTHNWLDVNLCLLSKYGRDNIDRAAVELLAAVYQT